MWQERDWPTVTVLKKKTATAVLNALPSFVCHVCHKGAAETFSPRSTTQNSHVCHKEGRFLWRQIYLKLLHTNMVLPNHPLTLISAPERSSLAKMRSSRVTSSATVILLVWIWKMRLLVFSSGRGNSILRSIRPGNSHAAGKNESVGQSVMHAQGETMLTLLADSFPVQVFQAFLIQLNSKTNSPTE